MATESSPDQEPPSDSDTEPTEITATTDAESVFKICGVRYDFKQTALPHAEHILEADLIFFETRLLDGPDSDVVIEIGGSRLRAHQALLRERITFFNCLFAHDFAEQSSGVVSLSTKFCPFEVASVRALIGYAYSGQLSITTDNAASLLETAVYLQMDSIVDACADFLVRRVRCEDALQLLTHFRSVGIDHRRLWRYVDVNFVPIARTTAFKALPASDLIRILQRDTLRIDGEHQIFEAVSGWMEADKGRWRDGARLLKNLRLPSLRSSFVSEHIASKDWVKGNPECMDLIHRHENPTTRARRNDRFCQDSQSIIVIFYFTGGVRLINMQSGIWTEGLTPTWAPRRHGEAVAIGSKVYFLGGDDDTSRVLDVYKNEWSQLAPLPDERDSGAVAALDSVIFYAGGHDDENPMASLIALDVRQENPQWNELAAMNTSRYLAASCVFNGKLFVFGGVTEGNVTLDACENYDLETNAWTPISPLPRPEDCRSALVVGDTIIVAGRGTFYEYSPLTDRWRELPSLPEPNIAPFLCFINGKVAVLPDTINWRPEYLSWIFDMDDGSWTKVNAPRHSFNMEDCVFAVPIPATVSLPITALQTSLVQTYEEINDNM